MTTERATLPLALGESLIDRQRQAVLEAARDFDRMTAQDALDEERRQVEKIGDALVRLAGRILSIERRGDADALHDFVNRHGHEFTSRLRRVATGSLLASLWQRFYDHKELLRAVQNLPIQDQDKLAAGWTIPLVVPGRDGPEIRERVPEFMHPHELRQALTPDRTRIRAPEEQIAFLDRKRRRDTQPLPEAVGRIALDPLTGRARIGKIWVTLADLEAAVRILKKGWNAA